MKKFYNLVFVLFCMGCCMFLVGCKYKTVPYSFTDSESDSATIVFDVGNSSNIFPGVSFVAFNEKLPPAQQGKWFYTHSPISIPAGEESEITVHAYFYEMNIAGGGGGGIVNIVTDLVADAVVSKVVESRYGDTDVRFTCPALEAGKTYKLKFKKGSGIPGKNTLILTDTADKKVIFSGVFSF